MVEAKEEWLFTKESSAAESNILEESGKELNMNTPEMNKQLEQLEQKKNEAALNTTMFS